MQIAPSFSVVTSTLALIGLLVGVHPASAQHFSDCLSPRDTGTDATVIVRNTVKTMFPNEASLDEGDEIALYTSDGTCAGSTTWTSSDEDVSISAAGPNDIDTKEGTSGYESGESLKVKVWDESEKKEYDLESIIEYESCDDKGSLCRDDGIYEESAIYSITQLGNSETLPVELVEFEAFTRNDQVRLEWTTASENNNVGFEVQHRPSNASWSTLEFVEGAGTASEPQHYTHTVTDLESGRHFFRLQQTDTDGATTLSDPISVEIMMEEEYEVGRVTPNPIQPHGQLVLRLQKAQSVTVSLFNTLGQQVQLLHRGVLPANKEHVLPLDGSALSSGRYIIRIQGETFSVTRPVTVLN